MIVQRAFQRLDAFNPKTLAFISVFLALAHFFVPLIVVFSETVSPVELAGGQKVSYLLAKQGISIINECSVVHVEWVSNVYEKTFNVLRYVDFFIFWYPVLLWGRSYLVVFKPPIFRFSLFVVMLFGLGTYLSVILYQNNFPSPNFCDPVPVVEVKYFYPFFPTLIILAANWGLGFYLQRRISAMESVSMEHANG